MAKSSESFFFHSQQHDTPLLHSAAISSSSEASCMNHSRIACITYCYTHVHGSLQVTLLRAKANSVTEAKQHNIGIYPQPTFPLLLCITCSLDESKDLSRYVSIIWHISSASASEVGGSRERVSCGASAYSMGKSFPLAPINTFLHHMMRSNGCLISLSSVAFPQYVPTHLHYMVLINPASCASKFC